MDCFSLRKNKEPIMKILWSGPLTNQEAIRIEKKLISVFRKKFELKNEDDRGLGGKVSTNTVHQYSLDGGSYYFFFNANSRLYAYRD